jgi:SAM-dependent methyltransferase
MKVMGMNAGVSSVSHRIVSCRICGDAASPAQAALVPVLDLGQLPLANRLLSPQDLDKPEPIFPLQLAFCPNCGLLQITETVPFEMLFREYLYFSSYSDTMLGHAQESAAQLIRDRKLRATSLVVEAGSNDGYMLQFFKAAGVPVLGVEPALNIAALAQEKGIETRPESFTLDLAQNLRGQGRLADVFLANNVLAHVGDLHDFLAGIRTILKDDGVAVVEVPYVEDMIDKLEFDTIYHEHLCFFSVTALVRLFERHDLTLVDVEWLPIHGGSLRLFAQPQNGAGKRGASTQAMLQRESQRGLDKLGYYQEFAPRVRALAERLRQLLSDLKGQGKKLAAYGAAAKGSILLNYCGIGRDLLDFVVDRSPVKQGKFMPGVQVPIWATQKLLEEMPDYVLLLTWNFRDEILQQQQAYRDRGGKFIIPVPEPIIM